MSEKIIYLNGAFVAESEAKVSVLDSGFNAGDGVYDVTRTFAHRRFRLREHTARLFRSLRYTPTRWRGQPSKYSNATRRSWPECDRLIQGVANQVRQVTARQSRRKLRKA